MEANIMKMLENIKFKSVNAYRNNEEIKFGCLNELEVFIGMVMKLI